MRTRIVIDPDGISESSMKDKVCPILSSGETQVKCVGSKCQSFISTGNYTVSKVDVIADPEYRLEYKENMNKYFKIDGHNRSIFLEGDTWKATVIQYRNSDYFLIEGQPSQTVVATYNAIDKLSLPVGYCHLTMPPSRDVRSYDDMDALKKGEF